MKRANLNHFNCSGIYIIRNIINNKMYIGSAINLRRRFHEHISCLRRNKHHSSYLQHTYNKNPNTLLFSILEPVKNKSLLIKREQYWMDFYRSYDKEIGYNQKPKADSPLGRKLSQSTKNKISIANSKSILLIFENGLNKEFRNQREAREFLNCDRAVISYNLKHKSFSKMYRCTMNYI